MKKITSTLIAGLFCLIGTAYAQDYEMPKNAIRIGINGAFLDLVILPAQVFTQNIPIL